MGYRAYRPCSMALCRSQRKFMVNVIKEKKLGNRKKIRDRKRKIVLRSISTVNKSRICRVKIRKREILRNIMGFPPFAKPMRRFHVSQTFIKNVDAKIIFDTRLNQTIEVDVWMLADYVVSASVPSGAPPRSNLWGPVRKAIDFVNNIISPALSGKDPREQAAIDNIMVRKVEETRKESGSGALKFGASAIFAVSLAVYRVGALAHILPLYKWITKLVGNKKLVMPIPMYNVFNFGLDPENMLSLRERISIYDELVDVEGFVIEDFRAVDYAGAAFNTTLTNFAS